MNNVIDKLTELLCDKNINKTKIAYEDMDESMTPLFFYRDCLYCMTSCDYIIQSNFSDTLDNCECNAYNITERMPENIDCNSLVVPIYI